MDLAHDSVRLINKVRPLLPAGGRLVTINNALFVSGRTYMESLTTLCADGYLRINDSSRCRPTSPDMPTPYVERRSRIPFPSTSATKIAVLEVVSRNP